MDQERENPDEETKTPDETGAGDGGNAGDDAEEKTGEGETTE